MRSFCRCQRNQSHRYDLNRLATDTVDPTIVTVADHKFAHRYGEAYLLPRGFHCHCYLAKYIISLIYFKCKLSNTVGDVSPTYQPNVVQTVFRWHSISTDWSVIERQSQCMSQWWITYFCSFHVLWESDVSSSQKFQDYVHASLKALAWKVHHLRYRPSLLSS